MKTGIQISSFRHLMTTKRGLYEVLGFFNEVGCRCTQLQWIDKSISPSDIGKALREKAIHSLGTQDKSRAVFGETDYYMAVCAESGGRDICVSGAAEMGTDAFLEGMDALYEAASGKGLTLSFHPVKADFDEALARVMKQRPYLKLTLDLCQAHDAGANAVSIINRYSGRIYALHLKDRSADGKLCAVGKGVVNFDEAVTAAADAGAEYLLAEQESWNDAYKELKQGYEYTLVLAQKYSR